MAKKSLRSQLNQIRAWVRQGRTDAWIAHQLEVPASELREFRRRHDLTADGEGTVEIDLRDEIEAEIEAAALAAEEEAAEFAEDEDDFDDEDEGGDEDDEDSGDRDLADEPDEVLDESVPAAAGDDSAEDVEEAPKRRRRRRGGRGRGRKAARPLEATFDHGDQEGYGLWLDPAVADNPAYKEHWKGQRAVEVEITAEQIIIRRAGSE